MTSPRQLPTPTQLPLSLLFITFSPLQFSLQSSHQSNTKPPRCFASYVSIPASASALSPTKKHANNDIQSKTLDPITLFHSPSISASTRTLNILKQASAQAASSATEDQASDHSAHAKQQRGQFELEITTDNPTTDQLRSILDYISPTSGTGGLGNKETYAVSELIRDAKNAEDAIKRFKADGNSFVKPVVSISLFVPLSRLLLVVICC